MLSLVLASTALAPVRILFVGNSHTAYNELPKMVQYLAESDGSGRKVELGHKVMSFLEDYPRVPEIDEALKNQKWDFVVLQGAKISSSHKYTYSQAEATKLAINAKKAGAKVFLFAEWSRKNWSESEYILNVYRGIAKDSGATVIPVPYSFDRVLRDTPKAALWTDGNHASLIGSYLAAATIYGSLFGWEGKPNWAPSGIEKGIAEKLRGYARGPAKD